MTYLSRELIRSMIIAEARKAPLLPGGGIDFDNEDTELFTKDLTDLDMSRVELTQSTDPVDIDMDTKIEDVPMPTDLRSLYQDDFGDDDFLPDPEGDEVTDPDIDVSRLRDFEEESYTEDNPDTVGHYVRDRAYQEPLLSDKVSPHDPAGRTYGDIENDVDKTYRRLYKPQVKNSESEEERKFLEKMNAMIADGAAAVEFPDDPEFAPEGTAEIADNTLELPLNRFNKKGLNERYRLKETIAKLIRESIRKKIKSISKNNLY
jgi:hypothetical protein